LPIKRDTRRSPRRANVRSLKDSTLGLEVLCCLVKHQARRFFA
jgi:hypothetical protein